MERETKVKSWISRLALLIPDKWFEQLKYYKRFRKWPDLHNPQSFNEKILWLKLHDRDPRQTSLVDKYEVKSRVAKLIGERHIIPTLGVWDRAEEIDFESLPERFVLKATHDSGRVLLCRSKSDLDTEWARKEMAYSLKRDFYALTREWQYKHVRRRIIAEEFIDDGSSSGLIDYKIFCFEGEPKFVQVDLNRFTDHRRNIYTTDWKLVDAEIEYPSDKTAAVEKPEKLATMLELASVLSKDFLHVRTDFYSIGDKIFFGELTFYHGSGLEEFRPESFAFEMGRLLRLPKK